jgi:hypothetical protein
MFSILFLCFEKQTWINNLKQTLFVLGCLSWKHQALLVKQSLAPKGKPASLGNLTPAGFGQGYESKIDHRRGIRAKLVNLTTNFVSSLGKVINLWLIIEEARLPSFAYLPKGQGYQP